jgi:uracil-DNA glycosylase
MTESDALAKLQTRIRRCRACARAGHAVAGRPIFSGKRGAKLMLVGQAPGATEVETGEPFSGPAGRRLFEWLARAGLSERAVRSQHYLTSLTRCHPGKSPGGRGDRAPTREELELCGDFLDAELAVVEPRLVVPVGRPAIRRFCGARPLDELVGTVQQDDAGRWIVPLPHPSGASAWLHAPANRANLDRALRHLARLRQRLGIASA